MNVTIVPLEIILGTGYIGMPPFPARQELLLSDPWVISDQVGSEQGFSAESCAMLEYSLMKYSTSITLAVIPMPLLPGMPLHERVAIETFWLNSNQGAMQLSSSQTPHTWALKYLQSEGSGNTIPTWADGSWFLKQLNREIRLSCRQPSRNAWKREAFLVSLGSMIASSDTPFKILLIQPGDRLLLDSTSMDGPQLLLKAYEFLYPERA